MSNRRWVSVRDAAAYFGMNGKTLYSLAARGLLPAGSVLRLGRQIRVDLQAIENNVMKEPGK